MFDKVKFAEIIEEISKTYNNQRDFSALSEINRTYLSQYKNKKLNKPPKPETLEKLANASNGIATYAELMDICGYTDEKSLIKLSLEQNYKKIEEDYLRKLYNIKLSTEEEEVYNDMFGILPLNIYNNLSKEEVKKQICSYFDNIDFLNEISKEKIINKLALFVEYCNQTENYQSKIRSLFTIKDTVQEEQLNKIINNSTIYACPVYGRISAGLPNWAEECIEGRIPIDPSLMDIVDPEQCYFLRVNGESMNKVIRNGAYALIRKQDIVDDGEIAVVLVNGFDATLKKFSKQGDFVVLEPMSTDSSFKVQIYDKNTPIQVIGKYIGKFEISK